jgi:hypothetical protein
MRQGSLCGMLRGASSKEHMQREGGCVVVRQGHLIAVVGTFVIGCAVLLLVVGCSGTRSEAPQEGKGHTEATKKEQTRSPEATASEEVQCDRARTIKGKGWSYVTNDVPGCPNGGLLLGTDKPDTLQGWDGDDEIRGLGAADSIVGGVGEDVIYGGAGNDSFLGGDEGDDVIYGGDGDDEDVYGGGGKDVLYGGDGKDLLDGSLDHRQRDELYCGKGKDEYAADKIDYVDSSCEKKTIMATG